MAKIKTKTPQEIIEAHMDGMQCPWCGKMANSMPGRTLHRKACKEKEAAISQIKFCKIGDVNILNHKEYTITHLNPEFGFVILNGNEVAIPRLLKTAREKLRANKPKFDRTPAGKVPILYPSPKTPKAWMESYATRCRERGYNYGAAYHYIMRLFKMSSFVKYKAWKWDDEKETLAEVLSIIIPKAGKVKKAKKKTEKKVTKKKTKKAKKK